MSNGDGLVIPSLSIPPRLPSRVLADAHADVTVVNTAALSQLCALAVDPTALAAGDIVHLEAAGDLLNNSGSAVTFQWTALLGGSLLGTTNALSLAASSNTRFWRMRADILVVDPKADQRATLELLINAGNPGFVLSTTSASGTFYSPIAEDLTVAKSLILQAQLGTAAPLAQMVLHDATLEVVKR